MPNKKLHSSLRELLSPRRVLLAILLLGLFSGHVYAQQQSVSGRVTAADGTPVNGASVTIRGSQAGTTTDAQGMYSISVARGASLVFSGVGFQSQSVKAGGQATINIVLQLADLSLNEVVVVGYGTQKKKNVTGSVVSITGDAMRDVPSPNISSAL